MIVFVWKNGTESLSPRQGKLSVMKPSSGKKKSNKMSIINQIKSHEKEVRSGLMPENLKSCAYCNEPSSSIKLHEARYRIFYYIIECYVYRKESWLGRWKCIVCKKTFTYYPDYCVAYKRYVKNAILKYSAKYLNNPQISYKKAVKSSFNVIVHKDKEETKHVEFSGTTIWRWQTFLSSLSNLKQKALQLVREKSSESTIFREVFSLSRGKYKTIKRKNQLLKSMKSLKTEEIFKSIFGSTIFPQFATLYG